MPGHCFTSASSLIGQPAADVEHLQQLGATAVKQLFAALDGKRGSGVIRQPCRLVRIGAPRRALPVTFDDYVRVRGPALVRLARLIAGDRR